MGQGTGQRTSEEAENLSNQDKSHPNGVFQKLKINTKVHNTQKSKF
jgi:hypothetical protein